MNNIINKKQSKKQKTNANSSALLNDTDSLNDEDDSVNEKFPRKEKLQYVRSKLLKSGDHQFSKDTNILRHLQYSDLSIKSAEVKTAQKNPLISVFDFVPKEFHDFWHEKTQVLGRKFI